MAWANPAITSDNVSVDNDASPDASTQNARSVHWCSGPEAEGWENDSEEGAKVLVEVLEATAEGKSCEFRKARPPAVRQKLTFSGAETTSPGADEWVEGGRRRPRIG